MQQAMPFYLWPRHLAINHMKELHLTDSDYQQQLQRIANMSHNINQQYVDTFDVQFLSVMIENKQQFGIKAFVTEEAENEVCLITKLDQQNDVHVLHASVGSYTDMREAVRKVHLQMIEALKEYGRKIIYGVSLKNNFPVGDEFLGLLTSKEELIANGFNLAEQSEMSEDSNITFAIKL